MIKFLLPLLVCCSLQAQIVIRGATLRGATVGVQGSIIDPLTNGLVGWWTLDETDTNSYADSSGIGNTGTREGALSSIFGQYGLSAAYCTVATANGDIAVPDNASLKFSTGDFAISAWGVNVGSKSDTELLVGKINSAGTGDNYWLGLNVGVVTFSISAGTAITGSTISDQNWHHYVGTRSNGVARLYVDGALVGSGTLTDSASPGGNLAIGSFGSLVGPYTWSGGYDDVRVYSRNLVNSDIQSLTNLYNYDLVDGTTYYLFKAHLNNQHTLVQYFGGSGEDRTAPIADSQKRYVIYSLLTNGMSTLSTTTDPTGWGNTTLINAYSNSLVTSTNGRGFTKFYNLSQSMGAISGLHLMTIFTNMFTKWYGMKPACALGYDYTNMPPPYPANIETAYGFSGAANFSAATAGFDPILYSTNKYGFATYRAIASAADTIVPRVGNAIALTNLLKWASMTNSFGDHGDPSSETNWQDVITFYGQ